MKLTRAIKPISYLKANAADIIRNIHKIGEPMIITQNGEAKAVLQDIESYERTQETIALLKVLALSQRQVEEGKILPAKEVFDKILRRKG